MKTGFNMRIRGLKWIVVASSLTPFLLFAAALGKQDANFLKQVVRSGRMEVQMGQVAVQKGHNDAVKAFGKRMFDEHSKADVELTALAEKKGLQLPPKDAAIKTEEAKSVGEAGFDKVYLRDMIADHQDAIKLFQKEISSGSDPEIKKWASDTLPTIEEHLKQAQTIKP
jgi:putative membrane protein